jgi:hypothetical protein
MLSNEKLEILVAKRNQEGKKHTVEVMTVEEMIEYRENCTQAIERLNRQIANAKAGGRVQSALIENLEMIEGFIAYIDSVTAEEKKPEGMAIIDTFLDQWKERAFNYYMGVRSEYEEIRSDSNHQITEENLKLITDVWGNRKLSDEKIANILNNLEEIAPPSISKMKSDIRWAKTRTFEKSLAKHEVELIKKMFGSQKEEVLKSVLNRDAESRKMKFIATITKKAGNILDANGLYFGPNGDINGFVIGDQKKVKVQTVYAGGHSVQILHYRVLVK